MASLPKFDDIWLVDFEFRQPDGHLPHTVCMVAREARSGRVIKLWGDELRRLNEAPFDTGPNSVFVAYNAVSELNCFRALGWPFPSAIWDFWVEFRRFVNGTRLGHGIGDALTYFGLPGIEKSYKDSMRGLILDNTTYTTVERERILTYCAGDVDALAQLLPHMLPLFDHERTFLRGDYMKAVAAIEYNGTPIDVELFTLLKSHWSDLRHDVVQAVNREFDVFEGTSFRQDRFLNYLAKHRLPWPRLPSGALDLKDATFKDMAAIYPQIGPLREVRRSLSSLAACGLAVGPDGRNRTSLRPFMSKTGRNQPAASKHVFGQVAWLRGLVKPTEGHGIAYIDWESQEFGIAAALSRDDNMLDAYRCGDPYLYVAQKAGAVPSNATKASHTSERARFKLLMLGVQYGMREHGVASRLGVTKLEARKLLELHRRIFPRYWKWAQAASDYAHAHGFIHTVYGWQMRITSETNPRGVLNFPMQANGAEMMRLACIKAVGAGVAVCTPVHDALLIEAPVHELEEAVALTRELMAQASAHVLNGFQLRTEAEVYTDPNRFSDKRGLVMWEMVMGLLNKKGIAPKQFCQPPPHKITQTALSIKKVFSR